MLTFKGVAVLMLLILVGLFGAGLVLGSIGPRSSIYLLAFCCVLIGAVATGGAAKYVPEANHSRVAAIGAALVMGFLVLGTADHYLTFKRIPWGSVLTSGPIIVGILLAWTLHSRKQRIETQPA